MTITATGKYRRKSGRLPRLLVLAGALSVLFEPPAEALDPARTLDQYVSESWKSREGVPLSAIWSMTQTRDGYLWLGTWEAVVRFDGLRFEVVDFGRLGIARGAFVLALQETRDGDLWAGLDGAGLVRMRQGRLTRYSTAHGLPSEMVRSLCEGSDGALLVGTTAGVARMRDGRFEKLGIDQHFPQGAVRVLWPDAQRNLWFAAWPYGLWRRNAEGLAAASASGTLGRETVRALSLSVEGRVCAASESGLYCQDSRTGRFEPLAALKGVHLRSLMCDRHGNLWAGSWGSGLFRVQGRTATRLAGAAVLPDDTVLSIYEDREGSLWIGTAEGLARLKDGRFISYTTRQGLSMGHATAVLEGRDGSLWVGSDGGGLARLRSGRITRFQRKDGLTSDSVRSLWEDADGTLWIGTSRGISVWRAGRVTGLPGRTGLGLTTLSVRAVCGSPGGRIWIGTDDQGLFELSGNTLTRVPEAGPNLRSIKTVQLDQSGRLWVGTADGAIIIAGGKASTVKLPRAAVHCFYGDRQGGRWIGTSAGLVWLAASGPFTFTSRDGLLDDGILSIVEDASGNFWMSSIRGVFRVPRRELVEMAKGRRKRLSTVAYGNEDGMCSSTCSGPVQPSACRSRDGRLWFPTIKGLVSVDPERIRPNPLAPPVHLEEVLADHKTAELIPGTVFPAGTRSFEFRYSGLSLLAPEKVAFRYRLEGFDPDWVTSGARRTAFYTNIPPGSYRFRVSARNGDGVWNEAGAEFRFTLAPFFYQRLWFYAVCAVLLAGAAFWAYRLRLRAVEARFEAILGERTRIAREIHDSLLQGFTGTALQLEAISYALNGAAAPARQQIEKVLVQIDRSLNEARQFIWDLRSRADRRCSLVEEVGEAVRHATESVHGNFQVFGAPRSVGPEVESQILQIAREAISNTVKHAAAAHLNVELRFESERLTLRVEDDGRGFDTGSVKCGSGHFGLVGMRERARQIRGQLVLESSPGSGTRIILEVAQNA